MGVVIPSFWLLRESKGHAGAEGHTDYPFMGS